MLTRTYLSLLVALSAPILMSSVIRLARADDAPSIVFTYTPLKHLGGHNISGLVVSANAASAACIRLEAGKEWVVFNDTDDPEYKTIQMLTLSPEGKHYVYSGLEKDKRWVVLDGKKAFDGEGRNFRFSPTGDRLAYTTRKDGFDRLIVQQTGGGGERQISEPYKYISPVVFSPDGKSVVYGYSEDNKEWRIVVNKTVSKPYLGYPEASFSSHTPLVIFSPDGLNYAYLASKNGTTYEAVINGEAKAAEAASLPTFSPDSKHYGYLGPVSLASTMRDVIVDGKAVSVPRSDIASLRWLKDGDWQLLMKRGTKYSLRSRDGEEEVLNSSGSDIEGLFTNSTNSHILYVKHEDFAYRIFLDTTELGLAPENRMSESHAIFSSNGRRYACVVRQIGSGTNSSSRDYVLLDGKKTLLQGSLDKHFFSPDGQHYCCLYWQTGRGPGVAKRGVLIDGQAARVEDINADSEIDLFRSIFFSVSDRLTAITTMGNGEVYRIIGQIQYH